LRIRSFQETHDICHLYSENLLMAVQSFLHRKASSIDRSNSLQLLESVLKNIYLIPFPALKFLALRKYSGDIPILLWNLLQSVASLQNVTSNVINRASKAALKKPFEDISIWRWSIRGIKPRQNATRNTLRRRSLNFLLLKSIRWTLKSFPWVEISPVKYLRITKTSVDVPIFYQSIL